MKYAEPVAATVAIPGKIIRFLEEGANVGYAGTRDGHLIPRGYRVSGWQIDAAGCRLTALIPASSDPRLLEALLDNGAIALTFEEVGTHETYQIKGRYLSHRPVRPAEIDIASRTRERFGKAVRTLYRDERFTALAKASIPDPTVAVEVEVREVFLQTPGPGAGGRIAPPPDADASVR
jgi:hypothetical protein